MGSPRSRFTCRRAALLATLCLPALLAGCMAGGYADVQDDAANHGTARDEHAGVVANKTSPTRDHSGATASATAGDDSAGGLGNFVASHGSPDSVQTIAIPDPTSGSASFGTITVPAGWNAQTGLVHQGCLGVDMPSPALDATSPDGKEEVIWLPQYMWRWGKDAQSGRGCVPLHGMLAAADALQALAPLLPGHVQIIGKMPVPDALRKAVAKSAAMLKEHQQQLVDFANRTLPPQRAREFIAEVVYRDVSADAAAARAVDGSGHELRLQIDMLCTQNAQAGNCIASMAMLRAAMGRLDALAAWLDSRPDLFKLTMSQPPHSSRTPGHFPHWRDDELQTHWAVLQTGRGAVATPQPPQTGVEKPPPQPCDGQPCADAGHR